MVPGDLPASPEGRQARGAQKTANAGTAGDGFASSGHLGPGGPPVTLADLLVPQSLILRLCISGRGLPPTGDLGSPPATGDPRASPVGSGGFPEGHQGATIAAGSAPPPATQARGPRWGPGDQGATREICGERPEGNGGTPGIGGGGISGKRPPELAKGKKPGYQTQAPTEHLWPRSRIYGSLVGGIELRVAPDGFAAGEPGVLEGGELSGVGRLRRAPIPWVLGYPLVPLRNRSRCRKVSMIC